MSQFLYEFSTVFAPASNASKTLLFKAAGDQRRRVSEPELLEAFGRELFRFALVQK